MLDSGRLDSHFDRVTPPNLANPLVALDYRLRTSNRLIQRFSYHVERVLVTIGVFAGNDTGSHGHVRHNANQLVAYSKKPGNGVQ
jgi:hypothetical protein